MKYISKFLNSHFVLFIPLLIIMFISLFNMQNAKLINDTYAMHLKKQMIWYMIGFIIILIGYKVNLKKLFDYSKYFYWMANILLLLVLLVGREINGARAWFRIGSFSFQPSELMKLALSLYLVYTIKRAHIKSFKDECILILKVLLITLIPSILVFLEPDTGAIIFYLLIASTLLFFSGIRKWWFLLLLVLLVGLVFSFYFLFNYNQNLLIDLIGTSFFYRVERLLTFTTNNSYQLENALIVIGSASLWGVGLNKGNLYIPEAPTDFIFAFNISNFGIVGGLVVLFCYLLIDLLLIRMYNKTKDKKIKLFLISFISIFFFQQVINIGMNLGLLPIIGIPLPFLSYGGSTIIIYFLYLSIIFNLVSKDAFSYY